MNIEELKKKVAEFPTEPGVYFFLNGKKNIIYVGKATSLRDRVRSYFGKDLINSRGPLLVQMVEEATDIKFIQTDSALEALILEANWIRKSKPRYNTREKDDKSYNYVIVTKEDYPLITTVRGRELEMAEMTGGLPWKIKYMFGPYPHGLQLREALKIVRRIFPYRDAKCTPLQGRPCFNRQLGLCPGTCTGEISKAEYGKTIRNLKLFFEGKKRTLLSTLEREMKTAAKKQEFEKAGKLRNTIFALTHIRDIALLKREEDITDGPVVRLEAYDIAHISGTNVVGVMIAVENGEAKKSDYRKFRIKLNPGVNDTAALAEVLSRRLNHQEWQLPTAILVDGGQAQMNAAKAVLEARDFQIPIVAVTKNDRHRPESFSGDEAFIEANKNAILLANSEAHRFAIAYHRNLRGRLR
ncbi:MAG TPA: UvrB/UvrC motif-containing protein [Candidatus Paceibacterota bacterium]|jgi:excinuclease ABC subunit C|nr:UvrB/UvrC motif-containing protein [Candidatus Paceibacterota bacterium]